MLIYFRKKRMTRKVIEVMLIILGYYVFVCNYGDGGGWFRLFGRGLSWKYKANEIPNYKRYGYSDARRVGCWYYKVLTKR
jgi:hypothetical protein